MPIVSISNLISGLIFGIVSLKLYFSYRKTKDEKIRDFFLAFLFLTLSLLLLATPGLVFTNLKIIGLIFAFYPFFVFLGFAYLGIIPLKILSWLKIQKIFFWGIIIIGVLITVFSIINWKPAVFYSQDPFVYWEDTRGVILNTIIGGFFGLGILLVMIFFFLQGIKSEDKYIRRRAFIIIGGLMILMLMGLTNFVFGASPQQYLTSVIASFLGISAGLIIIFSIFYKRKK